MKPTGDSFGFLGKPVTVTVDRPVGSAHPRFGYRYPLNYGFVPGTTSGDGEALDAYIVGVAVSLAEFHGTCVAVIRRNEEDDDKLVVAPVGTRIGIDEIRRATEFQERYFTSIITLAE